MLVTQANDVDALKKLIKGGRSVAMIAANGGYLETFKLLTDAGAEMNLLNKHGQTVMELFDTNQYGEEFERLLFKNAAAQKGLDGHVEFYVREEATLRFASF
ncbi:serine/threonine-protein phosphatase 6 regulatory ankyrin repeat subunit B-like [Pyrus ussuriensis x Pyrus communis]|uniref:Serine/threonine-protein phosphatase 6 regulatory ankyrin repeat subunit B-like n=1 Tax=Pyrus ussuriensis x Pyrus communis TaxID=2448454 RepID=A0A5N5HE88_9ROSA|nr:serine/threonine-protein phosphatase 6 regulatory ankyrin repeat subunit B-like [Pyrus ussuriensis x Pyrus communis]